MNAELLNTGEIFVCFESEKKVSLGVFISDLEFIASPHLILVTLNDPDENHFLRRPYRHGVGPYSKQGNLFYTVNTQAYISGIFLKIGFLTHITGLTFKMYGN